MCCNVKQEINKGGGVWKQEEMPGKQPRGTKRVKAHESKNIKSTQQKHRDVSVLPYLDMDNKLWNSVTFAASLMVTMNWSAATVWYS